MPIEDDAERQADRELFDLLCESPDVQVVRSEMLATSLRLKAVVDSLDLRVLSAINEQLTYTEHTAEELRNLMYSVFGAFSGDSPITLEFAIKLANGLRRKKMNPIQFCASYTALKAARLMAEENPKFTEKLSKFFDYDLVILLLVSSVSKKLLMIDSKNDPDGSENAKLAVNLVFVDKETETNQLD